MIVGLNINLTVGPFTVNRLPFGELRVAPCVGAWIETYASC